ncbi:MAG TPA: dienelactone hydrolase family protein [Nitrososphaeraceae archaeon]|nr:dienelactone hydrolase family protein [Nitrososphaeraceae archaeon]
MRFLALQQNNMLKLVNIAMSKRINLLLPFTFLIMVSLVLSATNIFYKAIPTVYAQTNSAGLASHVLVANGGNTTTKTTITNEGLEVKKDVKYFDGASGYLVYPSTIAAVSTTTGATGKKLPAVIMIHENRGINDNIRNMANTLAKQAGYVILAVDLFKGVSTNDPSQAMQLVKSVRGNPQEAISNLQAAVKYLSSLPFVDSSKIASIGWCFGGGQSLQLALHSEQHPLVATILYYGSPLVTDKQELSKIKWPVLGIFGDHDQAIPLQQINMFKAALDADGITNQIQIYKGLGHAFANPSGTNYAPKQTADAWEKTLAILKKYVQS